MVSVRAERSVVCSVMKKWKLIQVPCLCIALCLL